MTPEPGTPAASRVRMTELVLPNDANMMGNMLGGRVMHYIDMAGFLAANRHCRARCVTAAMERLEFRHPVKVGEIIVLEAEVTHAGTTSMEVMVDVFAEHPLTGERRATSRALLTFVAVDERGVPTKVPRLTPATGDEQRRFAEAEERRARRRTTEA